MSAKVEHWEDDEYVITLPGLGPVGPTFHKHDAEQVKRWLDGGGYKALAAAPSPENK